MDKNEFIELLRSGGYDAENIDGCVVVRSSDKATFRQVETVAKVVGYEGQFDWKGVRTGE